MKFYNLIEKKKEKKNLNIVCKSWKEECCSNENKALNKIIMIKSSSGQFVILFVFILKYLKIIIP